MSTGAPSHDTLALLPPPPAAPDPRLLWHEKVRDLCDLVRELTDVVQEQGRDIQALKDQLAAQQRDAATAQHSKGVFISRLASAARDYCVDMARSHEPEEEQQCQEEHEEEDQEEHEEEDQEEYEEGWEEDREHGGEHSSKKQRVA